MPAGSSPAWVLVFACSLAACSDHDRPLVVAHRGLVGIHPDNSIAGLLTAHALGADAVEFDVQLIDGEVLLAHDADPSCWETEPERFADFLAAEGGRYERLFVELKGTDDNRAALGVAAVAVVESYGALDRAVFTSFHFEASHAASVAARGRAEIGLQLFLDEGSDTEAGCNPAAARSSEADALALPADWVLWPAVTLDRADVALAHANGRKVGTWSSGENLHHIHHAIDLGVDAIYTDVPAVVRALVD